jgi:hypothetical protein
MISSYVYFVCSSIERFLGYDLTHRYLSMLLDCVLLMLLLFIWKPLALMLIYFEITCKIVVLTTLTISQAILGLYPLRLILLRPYYAIMQKIMSPIFLHGVNISAVNQNKKTLKELWECFTCVWSLSLLLRFISGRPSEVELKKHKRLAKFSIIYRVFMHII